VTPNNKREGLGNGSNLNANGLAFTFAALGEPGGETFREAFGSEAEAGFQASVGDRESVVELGGVGEVAHAELIEPVERAGFALPVDEDIDLKFLGVHRLMITPCLERQDLGES
jgi:hypothetical protein